MEWSHGSEEQSCVTKDMTQVLITNKEMFTSSIREKVRHGKERITKGKIQGHEDDTSRHVTSQDRKAIGVPQRTQESVRTVNIGPIKAGLERHAKECAIRS